MHFKECKNVCCFIVLIIFNLNLFTSLQLQTKEVKEVSLMNKENSSVNINIVSKEINNNNNIANSKDNLTTKTKNVFKLNNNFSISKFEKHYFIDTKGKSCDIFITENVTFNYKSATTKIHHLVISKTDPLFGFVVSLPLDNKHVTIENISVLQDKSLRYFTDEDGYIGKFKDRWLISVTLSKKVKDVSLIFSYYSQRGVQIDNENEKNIVKLHMTNPYNFDINNINLDLTLVNFKKLNKNELGVPNFGKISESFINNGMFKGKTININMIKNLPYNNEFQLEIALPLEIQYCETFFVNVINYGLIAMITSFLIISAISFYFLYKEY